MKVSAKRVFFMAIILLIAALSYGYSCPGSNGGGGGGGGGGCSTDTDCNDGKYCNGIETCNQATNKCVHGASVICSDGLYCDGLETCNEVTDTCDAGTPINCDEGKFCNEATDSCTTGCTANTDCNDNQYCNGTETCNQATQSCVAGTPVVCSDGLYCNGLETCNEATDSCASGTPVTCSDGQYCNGLETCNEATDSCTAGTPVICSDDLYCNGLETCNEATDSCAAGTEVNCDEGNHCDEATNSCVADTSSPVYSWTKRMGGPGDASGDEDDGGRGIAVDVSGNVYLTGWFMGTVNFAADWGGSDTKTAAGGDYDYDIFITRINANGSYGWTKRMGGTGDDYSSSIVVDGSGNVYLTGWFMGTVNFAADWGGSDTKTAAGGDDYDQDIFVTRINANGSYGWTRRIGGTDYDYSESIAVDDSGNVYNTGDFAGAVNFAADFGESDLKTSVGYNDIFVTRINANGSYGWTKRIGATESQWVYSITVDGNGNLYLTGYFSATVNFAEDWGGSDSKTSAGGEDIFVTRINANGSYGWTKRMGGSGNYDYDEGRGITVDGSGNVYLTGNFVETVNFAEDWGGSDSKTKAGDSNPFVTRINANGSYGWTKKIDEHCNTDYGFGITVDGSGNVYLTGTFDETVNFAGDWGGSDSKTSADGSYDIFVTRINANGSYGWTRKMGGNGQDYGIRIAVDGSGNVYLTGFFKDVVNFALDFGSSDIKSPEGDSDIFVTRIMQQ